MQSYFSICISHHWANSDLIVILCQIELSLFMHSCLVAIMCDVCSMFLSGHRKTSKYNIVNNWQNTINIINISLEKISTVRFCDFWLQWKKENESYVDSIPSSCNELSLMNNHFWMLMAGKRERGVNSEGLTRIKAPL